MSWIVARALISFEQLSPRPSGLGEKLLQWNKHVDNYPDHYLRPGYYLRLATIWGNTVVIFWGVNYLITKRQNKLNSHCSNEAVNNKLLPQLWSTSFLL